ncbi:type II toxin-antitoxin system VapC family toxin [Hoeflea olei]|uniref:Twitching motility protein PilT n=1 Tax=Hoeflea olei TaxID=1480615 RepID=A0A1C1YXG7_9HYPH|nr:type II toxin-antitoxin system VapC family toxin [Hoeflea olei]OCW58129.1 twitching motility protein PilT [Hoeflea olei]
MTDRYLLDTCAVIWLMGGDDIEDNALKQLAEAQSAEGLVSISAMTAWEIGMLASKNRLASTRHPLRWFKDAVGQFGADVEEVSPDVLVASSFLPAPIHNDPMDRILIATARERDLTIVTRDRAILSYGALGHVKTLPC